MQEIIQKYKTTTMQRILQSVSRGYYNHISGECPADRLIKLMNKFDELYAIKLTRRQRHYRKSKGRSVVRFFAYPHKTKPVFYWWLLASYGESDLFKNEKMKDARKQSERIKWDDEYRILKLPKPESDPTWTWTLTREKKHEWIHRINQAVRFKNKMKMRQALYSLGRMPGFRGNRQIAFVLGKKFKTEWDRIMDDKADVIEFFESVLEKKVTNKHLPMRINQLVGTLPDEFVDTEWIINKQTKKNN